MILKITLPANRERWLREMAFQRQISVEKLVTEMAHNETLHYQMNHFPLSHPDDSPQEAKRQVARNPWEEE